ncbi:MAG: anti-sigma factor [Cyanobacteria bacterium J06638_28]
MSFTELPDNWHDLIAGYTLGNLTPAEQSQLEALLQQHPELQGELQSYAAALAQLPQTLELQTPSAELEQQILQKLHMPATIGHPGNITSLEPHRRWRSWWGVGAAIAAGVLIVLVGDNYRLRQSLQQNQQALADVNQTIQTLQEEREQLQQEQIQSEAVLASLRTAQKSVYSLEGTGELADASGSVVTLAEAGTAILVPHNLPELPPEQVYRLWAAVDKTDSLVYCGQFNTHQDQAIQWPLPEDVCSDPVNQVFITVDPVTASTDSGGKLVMKSIPTKS